MLPLIALVAALHSTHSPASDRVQLDSTCLCAVSEELTCAPAGTCVCITHDGWIALSLGTEDESCDARPPLALSGRPAPRPAER